MPAEPPILDSRVLQDILKRLQELAGSSVREWTPPTEGDAGTMLQRMFARLLELAIQRLNQVPEKNLLAFLDTMGVTLLPPSPAKVPLTFTLTIGSPPTLVPKGTQAGTQPRGQQSAVIFETEDDLTVIPAQITQGFTMDPTWDRYTDQTTVLGGQSSIGFTPFVGAKRMPHILYLGDEALLNFVQATIDLNLQWQPAGTSLDDLRNFLKKLTWQYTSNGQIKTLMPTTPTTTTPIISLSNVESIDQTIVQGVSVNPGIQKGIQGRWLRAVLTTPIPDSLVAQDLRVKNLSLTVKASNLLPNLAFINTAPLDVTKDFLPFGATPKVGDAFYMGSQETFSKPGATVTLSVNVPPPPTLVWEYWSADGTWIQLDPDIVAKGDGTKSFTTSGSILLARPANMAPTLINGVNAFWFRVRVAGGVYRSAPRLRAFQLQTPLQTTLQGDVAQGANSIVLADPKFSQLDDPLLVGDEFVQGIGSDGSTLRVALPFRRPHTKGTPVELRPIISNKSASLKEAVVQGQSQIIIDLTQDIREIVPQQVLNIGNEFITAKEAQPSLDGKSVRIITDEPLRFSYGVGTGVQPVVSNLFGVPKGFPEGETMNFTEPFLPFEDQPNPGDTFYFGTAVGTSGGLPPPGGFGPSIHIVVDLSLNVQLTWDFLGINGWRPFIPQPDGTNEFLNDGDIVLVFPEQPSVAAAQVNGQRNYWIRVRITDGNYGLPVEFIPVDLADPSKGFKVNPATGNLNPPVISKLTLRYEVSRVPTMLTRTGFFYSENDTPGGFAPFVSVTALPPAYADPDPAFYLGFDAAFPEEPVRVYFDITPRAFAGSVIKEARAAPVPFSALPQLQWEYYDGTAWRKLTVFDDTNNLTESGTVEFLTPTGIATLARFDLTERYWIRARSSKNDPVDTQQLQGVFPNTIPATQAVTVQNEIVGSSNGQPNQVVNVAGPPVLSGQQVMVIEPESPSDQERAAIEAEESADAVQEVINPTTGETEIQVRWHAVPNFVASDPHNRHYTLDHTSGLLTFGDGKRGSVLPPGTNNILANYRSGGGAAGNVPKGAVAQVKSPLPGVGGVTNFVGADGGAEVETIPMVEDRGPQTLRHRDRAVACSDLEYLARQAAGTRVARTKCVSNVNRELRFEPGWVTLLIVPQGSEPKLSPSSELIHEVEDYLEARAFVGLSQQTAARVNIIGPGYIQVAVLAEVVAQDIDETELVKQRILMALTAFFHPLRGGPNSTGWEFGRDVYVSEVAQLIEGVPGVDHVKSLQLHPNIAQHRLTLTSAPFAGMTLPMGGAVMTTDRSKAALLAERASTDGTAASIAIKGFKEGDRITKVLDLTHPNRSGKTVVDGISRPVITVDSFNSDAVGFPRRSVVTTFDGAMLTRLAVGIPPNEPELTQLVIEDDDFAFQTDDVLTIYYPFAVIITSVTLEAITLTVQSVAATTITIAPFNTDAAGLPLGSPVTIFDSTLRTRLAQAIPPNQTRLTQITVQDSSFAASLQPGDLLKVQAPVQTLDIEPYETDVAFPEKSVLATLDNRVRLPLLTGAPASPVVTTITSVQLLDFVPGDRIIGFGRNSQAQVQSLTIQYVEPVNGVVYLDDNFLVDSGNHSITMVAE